MNRGTLFLVVGPSGVGKDTLIHGARERLGPSGRYVFAQRVITREVQPGGEPHRPVSAEVFAAMERNQEFLQTWVAHGFHYGLPAALRHELEMGRHVVANGSRTVIRELAARVPHLTVVQVTSRHSDLAGRLQARHRETEAEIQARLAREVTLDLPAGVRHLHVHNGTTVEAGVARFVEAPVSGHEEALTSRTAETDRRTP